MASLSDISWQGFLLRFLLGILLVFGSYNPSGLSFYHWATPAFPQLTALQAFAGVVLLIGWAIFIRAALRSLGLIGLTLALAFFGTLFWLLIDSGIIAASDTQVIEYIALLMVAAVLSTGLSWSHVRRRLSGQMDTDDV